MTLHNFGTPPMLNTRLAGTVTEETGERDELGVRIASGGIVRLYAPVGTLAPIMLVIIRPTRQPMGHRFDVGQRLQETIECFNYQLLR